MGADTVLKFTPENVQEAGAIQKKIAETLIAINQAGHPDVALILVAMARLQRELLAKYPPTQRRQLEGLIVLFIKQDIDSHTRITLH